MRGTKKGIDTALEDKELEKSNPYNPFYKRELWEAYSKGLKDGFVQGVKQREQQRTYQQLKELSDISITRKNKGLSLER